MKKTCLAVAGIALVATVSGCNAWSSAPSPQNSSGYTWQNVKIVAGGFVPGIEFSPAQKGLVYARTDIGGFYRWDQSLGRWTPLTDWVSAKESNLLGGESLAVDPVDANRVYIAAGMYMRSWASNGAIFRSDDQGRTWQRTDMPFKMGGNEDGRSMGERLVVDPRNDAILFFGSRANGLWRSADYGATWEQVSSFPVAGDPKAIGISFIAFGRGSSEAHTIFVGATNSPTPVYESADGGGTWEAVASQPTGWMPQHGAVDASGTLYVTYGNSPGPNGVSDGGVWKLDPSGGWTDISPLHPHVGGEHGFGYAGLALDALHPGTLLVSTLNRWYPGDDIFRTTDGGKTWHGLSKGSVRDDTLSPYLNWAASSPPFGWWIGTVAIDPFDSAHVMYGTGATIWSSDDVTASDASQPTHWQVGANGIEETAVNALASPPAGPHLISGVGDIGGFTHDDVDVSPRGGMSKNPLFGGTTSIDYAALAPNVVVRVGTGGNGVRPGAISTDGGATWSPFGSEPADSKGDGSVAISADGHTILWAPKGSAASVSRDGGATWAACSGAPNGAAPVADRVDPTVFYTFDSSTGSLLISTDSGASFAVCCTGLPEGRAGLHAVPGNRGDLWLSANDRGLYHSTDAGKSFSRDSAVQDADAVGLGKPAPGSSYPAIFMTGQVAGVYGIYRSDDGGATWLRINDDTHQYGWIGHAIEGDPRVFGRVYVATNGRGIVMGQPATQ